MRRTRRTRQAVIDVGQGRVGSLSGLTMQQDSRPFLGIDAAGWPFVVGAAALAAVAALTAGAWAAVPCVALTGLALFFFRDPERQSPGDPAAVLSPADGRVTVAGPADRSAPPGDWQQISIFLSPLDVHVNRVPVSGIVTQVTYRPGRYLPAYRPEAGSTNERSEVWVDHGGQSVVFRQVVGVLARRVVCRLEVGRAVQAGARFGVMKFGSRMDVFLPVSAELRVSAGDRVIGGETVLARM
jgi:phosphatidylserine decarboxylase